MSIYSKLSALLTAANTKTGESDTTLTDAVQTLIDGYGQGGGGIDWDDYAAGLEPSGQSVLDTTTQLVIKNKFSYMTSLTSFSAPLLTTITGINMFQADANLETVNLPNVTNLPTNCFYDCKKLTGGNFPKVTEIGASALSFAGQSVSGSIFVLPEIVTIGNDGLRQVNDYAVIDLGPNLTKIPDKCFYNHTYKGILILRASSVVPCNSSSAIWALSRPNSVATVYVPQSLITTYQNDTNWSLAYAAGTNFTAIEGTTYATHYADGTVIPT